MKSEEGRGEKVGMEREKGRTARHSDQVTWIIIAASTITDSWYVSGLIVVRGTANTSARWMKRSRRVHLCDEMSGTVDVSCE